jgi:hypothetical protein
MATATDTGPYRKRPPSKHVQKALEHLREHVADPELLEDERLAIGTRVRPRGWLGVLLSAIGVLVVVATVNEGEARPVVMGCVLAGLGGLLAYLSLEADLSLVPRDRPSSPEATLKAALRALTMGRNGYAWATLSPRARSQTVRMPDLGHVEDSSAIDLVEFPLSTPEALAKYASTFAQPGAGLLRRMVVEQVARRDLDQDIARIEVTLSFQSLAVTRPSLGNILLLMRSPKHRVSLAKTMLRADNGVWYLYEGAILEDGGG